MLNQVVLVGRIAEDINDIELNRRVRTLTLAIPRSYKNTEGVYETDFIEIELWNGIASNAVEYCRKGDIVGVKGCLQTRDNKMIVLCEKLTFLSCHSNENYKEVDNNE